MKRLQILAVLGLAVLLALTVTACQKKAEMEPPAGEEVGMGEPAPATDTELQPPPETPPVSEPPPAPKPTRKSTSGTKTSTPAYVAEARTIQVPVGTVFDVAMVTPVDTRTSNVGDKIEAKLMAPIVSDGVTIAHQDAIIRGEVTDVQRASRSKSEEDRASLILTFTSLETVEGVKALHATVTNSEGKLIAKSTSTRDKLIIGGSAVAGAIIGKVAGKDTKSTVIGAVGGAVLGTGAVLASKGHELEVPTGSKVTLRVDEPITIVSK